MRRVLTLAVMASLVTGCGGGLFESKKIDYKSAGQLPPLELPPDLTSPTRDDRYAVPDVNPRGSATFSAYSAERVGGRAASATQDVLPKVDAKMRVERSGSQRWLVVPGTPDKLWGQVKDFWLEMGFILNIDRPEIGVMETDWAEDRAKIPQDFLRSALGKVIDGLYSVPERDKFRTRFEKGSEPGTVEIYVSHRGMVEIFTNEAKDTTVWQPRQPNPELEAEILSRLMIRLGSDEAKAKAAMAAPQTSERARLVREAVGAGRLQVDEPFDRAWRRVGLSLDRVGFTVEDRDRAAGVYYVRYVDPEADAQKKEEGLLSKLAFWRAAEPKVKNGDQFRIAIKAQGDATQVQVLTREGGSDSSETARKILNLLYEQLR